LSDSVAAFTGAENSNPNPQVAAVASQALDRTASIRKIGAALRACSSVGHLRQAAFKAPPDDFESVRVEYIEIPP
jgi:hypothetical protein